MILITLLYITDEVDDADTADADSVPYESLRPTYTHEAIAKLMELEHIKHVITQNCDGLHTLAGLYYLCYGCVMLVLCLCYVCVMLVYSLCCVCVMLVLFVLCVCCD